MMERVENLNLIDEFDKKECIFNLYATIMPQKIQEYFNWKEIAICGYNEKEGFYGFDKIKTNEDLFEYVIKSVEVPVIKAIVAIMQYLLKNMEEYSEYEKCAVLRDNIKILNEFKKLTEDFYTNNKTN